MYHEINTQVLIKGIMVLLIPAEILSQVNTGFQFQAVARDAQLNIMKESTLSEKIGIRSGSEAGELVWQEDHNTTTNKFGLIAEEVEKAYPLLVSYNEKGEPETVSYGQLIIPLLKAVQDQHKEIEALKKEIEELKQATR